MSKSRSGILDTVLSSRSRRQQTAESSTEPAATSEAVAELEAERLKGAVKDGVKEAMAEHEESRHETRVVEEETSSGGSIRKWLRRMVAIGGIAYGVQRLRRRSGEGGASISDVQEKLPGVGESGLGGESMSGESEEASPDEAYSVEIETGRVEESEGADVDASDVVDTDSTADTEGLESDEESSEPGSDR